MAGIDPRTGVLVCTVFRFSTIYGGFPVFPLGFFFIGMVGVPVLLYYDLKNSDRWAETELRKADDWRASWALFMILFLAFIPFLGDLMVWGLYLFRGAVPLLVKTAGAFWKLLSYIFK